MTDEQPGASSAQDRHEPGATSASTRQDGTSPAEGRHEHGVSLQEAALQLDISERTVRRMLQEGELQGYKQKATRGYVWRVVLDSPPAVEVGTADRQSGNEVGASPAPAQELLKTLELVERLQDDHQAELERLREDHQRQVEQTRQDLQGQIQRLERDKEEMSTAAAHWQARFLEEHDRVLRLLPAPKDEPAGEPTPAEPERRNWWQRLVRRSR